MTSFTIVEYLGESNNDKCGYCKTTGRYNSSGFWAHTMQVEDYQSLINRNWRRSGQYCYKPKNSDTCCPMYTIKCDAMNFKLSRSHKKILKRMNKFLKDGSRDKNRGTRQDYGASETQEPKPSKEPSELVMEGFNVSSVQRPSGAKVKPIKEEISHPVLKSNVCDKPTNPKKAKIIRLERKKAKLEAKGLTLADVVPKKRKSAEKSLEDFLAQAPTNGKHRLEVRLDYSFDHKSNCQFAF